MPSFPNTLRRCHSTVRGLRNSWAPISGFVRPSAAALRDLQLLRGQVVERLDRALAHRLPGGEQLATRALGEDLHADLGQQRVRGAELLAGVDAAVLAPQPLAVDQHRAAERDADAGAGEALDRLSVEQLGGRRPRSAAPASGRGTPAPSRCRWPRRSPSAARARRRRARACRCGRRPRRDRPAATSGRRARARPGRPARRRPARRRTGRGRCSGRHCPSPSRSARGPRRAASPPACGRRPAPAPRRPGPASWRARSRRGGRRGCRSPPRRRPPRPPARSPRRAGRRRGRAWIRSSRATGSRESAPTRRASSTWRSVSSSHATSSPRARAIWQASHSQRSSSSSERRSSRNARSASFSAGAPAA